MLRTAALVFCICLHGVDVAYIKCICLYLPLQHPFIKHTLSLTRFVCAFQATVNLPESGVVTSDTWQALLGPNATPVDARNLVMNDETDEDMTADHEGCVYLVGEQRWSRKPQAGV